MRTSGLRTALWAEMHKAAATRVLLAVTIALVGGIALLSVVMTAAVRGGRADLAAKLGPLAGQPGWAGYLAGAAQITAAAVVLGFGVALSWLFGREFADGTVTGLFALPVTRPAIAVAKLLTYGLWALLVATALSVLLILGGLVLGLGPLDAATSSTIAREWSLVVLSALVATPVAWVTSLTRGLLGGIAATIALIVCAQVFVLAADLGGWFPIAAPALWAIAPGTVSAAQLALVVLIPLGSGLATLVSWHRLQLDR